jgi:hypothetical protein
VVKQEKLEEQLEEQAQKNGAPNAPAPTAQANNALPKTGLPLLPIVALGSGLVALGGRLRKKH